MMSKFRVKYSDHPDAVYQTKPKDIVAFERATGLSSLAAFATGEPRLEHLWLMAHCCAKRVDGAGRTDFPEFDDWLDGMEDVSVLDADAEDDPGPLGSSPASGI